MEGIHRFAGLEGQVRVLAGAAQLRVVDDVVDVFEVHLAEGAPSSADGTRAVVVGRRATDLLDLDALLPTPDADNRPLPLAS